MLTGQLKRWTTALSTFAAVCVALLGPAASAEMVGPPEVFAGVTPGTGACCAADGVCTDNVTFVNCEQIGGSWGGGNSTCISNICGPTGGCCYRGTCDFGESQRYCEFSVGGRWYPTCGDPDCNPVGACCFGAQCFDQTENLCFLNGGTFQYGSTCASTTCTGACCLPNAGGCVEVSEMECGVLEGAFEGLGTFCNGFQCPGACCDKFGFCLQQTPYDCFITGGTFIGGLCENAKCIPRTGACCLLNGTCQDGADFGLCVEFGGAWGGIDSTCASITCSDAGSCCFEFAPGSFFCQRNMFEIACLDQGGTFNGPGSTCSPNPCGIVLPTGACCLPGTTCDQRDQAACTTAGGLYRGDGTVCSPALCCPADFNNDGFVNTPDLTYFLGRFGGTFNPPGSERADLNADGLVNTADLTKFLGAFGRSCPY